MLGERSGSLRLITGSLLLSSFSVSLTNYYKPVSLSRVAEATSHRHGNPSGLSGSVREVVGGVIRQEGEIRELISPFVDKRVAGLCQ